MVSHDRSALRFQAVALGILFILAPTTVRRARRENRDRDDRSVDTAPPEGDLRFGDPEASAIRYPNRSRSPHQAGESSGGGARKADSGKSARNHPVGPAGKRIPRTVQSADRPGSRSRTAADRAYLIPARNGSPLDRRHGTRASGGPASREALEKGISDRLFLSVWRRHRRWKPRDPASAPF